MNTSIAALKRSRSNLDALTKELSGVSSNTKQSYVDDRFIINGGQIEPITFGHGYLVRNFGNSLNKNNKFVNIAKF